MVMMLYGHERKQGGECKADCYVLALWTCSFVFYFVVQCCFNWTLANFIIAVYYVILTFWVNNSLNSGTSMQKFA